MNPEEFTDSIPSVILIGCNRFVYFCNQFLCGEWLRDEIRCTQFIRLFFHFLSRISCDKDYRNVLEKLLGQIEHAIEGFDLVEVRQLMLQIAKGQTPDKDPRDSEWKIIPVEPEIETEKPHSDAIH